VRAGEMVALRFDNSNPMPYAFDIDELNVHDPVAADGQSLIMFEPTVPSSYTFYCSVPGHRDAGMVGTLVVEP
jgi:nitrite reductase (NO-forming)